MWIIEATGGQRVRSLGRTVTAAVGEITEALVAANGLDTSEAVALIFDIDNNKDVSAALRRLQKAKDQYEEVEVERRSAIENAIDLLRGYGMSYRDVGSVIGMSQQRVAQIGAKGW